MNTENPIESIEDDGKTITFNINAREFGRGIAEGVMNYLAVALLCALIFLLGIQLIRNAIGFGVDDSDKDAWNRSGLRVHTDHRTGIQYLSDGNGGLTRRAEK